MYDDLNSFKKNNKLILKSCSSSFFLRVSERKKSREKRVENQEFSWHQVSDALRYDWL